MTAEPSLAMVHAVSTATQSGAIPLPEGDVLLAGLLMAAGVAVLTLVVLVRLRRQRRRQSSRRTPGVRARGGVAGERGVVERGSDGSAALERLMVEAQELTRVCAAQLENRVRRLETVIARADERIAELERRGEAVGRVADDRSGRTRPAVHVVPGRPAGPSWGDARARSAGDEPLDPLTERVLEMSGRGCDAVTIARELDEQTGTVELILALRGR